MNTTAQRRGRVSAFWSLRQIVAVPENGGYATRRLGDSAALRQPRDVACLHDADKGAHLFQSVHCSQKRDSIFAMVSRVGIGIPICKSGIPTTFKAWVDMVAGVRLTFRYTEEGPVRLFDCKRAYLVVASGGTAIGIDIDLTTGDGFYGDRRCTDPVQRPPTRT